MIGGRNNIGTSAPILQVTEGLGPALGGTALVARQISTELAQKGVTVSLWGLHKSSGDGGLRSTPAIDIAQFRPTWSPWIGYSRELGGALKTHPRPAVVHIHGLWKVHFAQVARHARRNHIPVVVSAHGMAEEWALRQKAGIKKLARHLYQDQILEGAASLHASSREEVEALRRMGLRRPIALIPWGVERPDGYDSVSSHAAAPRSSGPARRMALALSRLHPKKGLDLLLDAWSKVHRLHPEWELTIAGYDEKGTRKRLVQRAASLGLRTVRFLGPVEGREKEELFSAAELFILPSRSENFGLVVAEALTRGLPVITTRGAPWGRIVEKNCGWWVEFGEKPLTAALTEALGKSPEELRRLGANGQAWVRRDYTWDACAEAFIALYRWNLGESPRPAFVQEEAG